MNKNKKIPKQDRPYAVIPYNPKWEKIFAEEKKILLKIFSGKALKIEHIGSTAVEGMWAKPQIDILIIVEDLNQVDRLIDKMKLNGYEYLEEFNKFNERYFVRDAASGERLVSIHVMPPHNPQAQSHLYLRDYLHEYPQEKESYSKVKKEAYQSGANRMEYPERKREVLHGILERAKQWNNENQVK